MYIAYINRCTDSSLFLGSPKFIVRDDGSSDVLEVPESVLAAERNYTRAHANVHNIQRHSDAPAKACVLIKVIYNNGWVNSSANGDVSVALQKAIDVTAELENIYNHKFDFRNQLGTDVKFRIVGGGRNNVYIFAEFRLLCLKLLQKF